MGKVKPIRVAIVILNWNRGEMTKGCVERVVAIDRGGLDVGVIVVDNGSTDDSVSALRKWIELLDSSRSRKCKILENRKNFGFAGGNNIGVKVALDDGADYVLIMNNDVEVREDLVVKLVEEMEINEKWGVISPKIYFAKGYEFHRKRYRKKDLGKVIWYAGGCLDKANVLASHRGVDEVDGGQYGQETQTDFCSGSCMLVRSKVLSDVGYFDEDYFLYWEDVDFCMRARERGWGVIYSPITVAWHKVSSSSAIGSDLNDYFITRNRLKFGMKYVTVRAKAALIRESLRLLISGRKWQRRGVIDYYLERMGRGGWK